MASTAYQTQYRTQFIEGFEDGQSRLRQTTVTEAAIKGTSAVFLVADSGSATAVTRGVNGLIPSRGDNLTQYTATLQEWHDLVERTKFNIDMSQGDGRRIMQATTMKTINRKIDDDIIAQLDTATVDTGTAQIASVGLVAKSLAILGNAFVDVGDEENIFGLITPAFHAYLMQTKEFASADYVEIKPFSGSPFKVKRWFGVNWIIHPRLTGVSTASEKCYLYHRNAIGHAIDMANMDIASGYEEKQSLYWQRCSTFMGSKLLQNTGVVQMLHDGSAYVGA